MAPLAARQHRLLTAGQLAQLGVDRAYLRRQLRAGRWRLVRRGVVAIDPLDDNRPRTVLREHVVAALLLLPVGSVACERTAVVLHGFSTAADEGDPVDVLLPPGVRHGGLLGVRLHQGPPAQIELVNDVPCTVAVRSLLDTCAVLPLDEAVALLDSADRAEPGTIMNCRTAAVTVARRGRRRLQAALSLATGLAESPLESFAWVLWHLHGLPMPVRQAVISCRRRAGPPGARSDR